HIILQPLANEDTGYSTEDLVPVSIFQTTPIGIAVAKDSNIKTLDDLIQKANDNPGNVTVSGSGTYSGHQITLMQLEELADVEMKYVPSDGAAPSIQAFLGGNTEVVLGNSDDLIKYKDDMRILAIGTEESFEPLPDVPTFKEEGVDMTAGIDRGVAVPPGTDEEVISTLEDAFLKILDEEGVKDQMLEEGFQPKEMGHSESVEYIKEKRSESENIMEYVE